MELATEHDRHEIYLISSITAANLIKRLGCSRYAMLCHGLHERRPFKLFRKAISSKRGAALNTQKASSAAFAVCLRTFGLMAHIDARPHLLRLHVRAARTAVALDAARGEQKGTPLTSGGWGGFGRALIKCGVDDGATVSHLAR